MKQNENEMFKDRLSFLSNMEKCDIEYKGYNFSCVESAYQSMKCELKSDRKKFSNLNGYEAKKLGRKIKMRSDWDNIKFIIMKELVSLKFSKEPFKTKLMDMVGPIIEFNYWKDTYWGVCNGVGQNKLGKILMEIRDKYLLTSNIINGNLYTKENWLKYDHIGFTANSTIGNNCKLIMGAGNAKIVRDNVKGIDIRLGKLIKNQSEYNIMFDKNTKIFAFQTKIHWKNKSPITLIKNSLFALAVEANEYPGKTYALPIPGIGHGGFTKSQIEPLLYSMPKNVYFFWL